MLLCVVLSVFIYLNLPSVKAPFDAEAGIAHEAVAGEVVTKLDLGTDMQVRACTRAKRAQTQTNYYVFYFSR